jgi:hypothetical protein
MPSLVARTGNNLSIGGFIPEIWSTHLNYKFYKTTYWHLIANRDWEGEISGKGSKVIIRVRPTVAVNKNYKENQKRSSYRLTMPIFLASKSATSTRCSRTSRQKKRPALTLTSR